MLSNQKCPEECSDNQFRSSWPFFALDPQLKLSFGEN